MLSLLWRLAAVISVSSTLIACGASLQQLPDTAADAFALDPRTLDHRMGIETLTVRASPPEALTAAEEALGTTGFVLEAPAATAERRCGSRQSIFGEGTTWACFFVRGQPPEQTTVRVVTVSWRPLGAIAGKQTYPEELASAFQGRLANVQGR
jgi:hypothetical protein